METVGSYQARTHLPRLLEQVERGETIIITRYGTPVARHFPALPVIAQPTITDVLQAMRVFQEHEAPTLGDDLSVYELINKGRRF